MRRIFHISCGDVRSLLVDIEWTGSLEIYYSDDELTACPLRITCKDSFTLHDYSFDTLPEAHHAL